MKSEIFLVFLVTVMNLNFSVTEAATAGRQCWSEDENLPHETKCNLYYRCVYGNKVLKECPEKKMFNPELGNCDESYNVACGSLETSQDEEEGRYYGELETTHQVDPKWTEKSPNEVIVSYVELDDATFPSECPENTDPYEEATLLPHENWCNAFYKCSNKKKHLMFCPGMLQFNPRVLSCDWPINAKCVQKLQSTTSSTESILSTKPSQICPQNECQDSTIYLPYRSDPRKFIRCVNGQDAIENCPEGLIFDKKLSICNLIK